MTNEPQRSQREELQRLRFEVFATSIYLDLRRTSTGLYRKATTQVGWVCWQEAEAQVRDAMEAQTESEVKTESEILEDWKR